MVRARVPAICAVVLLLAAACSGDEKKEASQSSLTPVSRPIVDIVPAASIDKDGQPVDPALVFAPDAPLITVVAQVGELTGSPMAITWSQVTDGGEKKLFTHTVEVASFKAAYSVGKSPGTLTTGTYRVKATLEGQSRSTQFDVAAPEGTGAAGQSATSGPPASGDSGAVGPPVDPAAVPGTQLFTFVDWAPVDPDASKIGVTVYADQGGDRRVEVKATMGGNTRTVSRPADALGFLLDFRPCVHPGGSDLPGTTATFESTLYTGNTVAASNLKSTTLGPDKTPPLLEVTSDPAPGSKVEPGQPITVKIVGRESSEGTWQTGVKQIKLTDFGTGAVVGEHIFGEQALPCAQKAWSKGLDVPYTVPEDAPPQIRLMAEAFDFAQGRGSFGVSYFTGEVWRGPVTGQTTQPGCSPSRVRVTGKLEIVVRTDEPVTGSVTEGRGTFSCGGTAAPAYEKTFQITGQKTDAAFKLNVSGKAITLPIRGNRATVTMNNLGAGGYGAKVTYTVDCKNCE